jgi:chitodextrinase
MTRWQTSRLVARVAGVACVLALLLGSSTVSAGARDRKPPTRPTNLHVTATTPYSVSLAWDPSTDNSGSFSYRVLVWGYASTVPQTQTTFTWTSNVAGNTYSFYVYAVDAAGNQSQNSNTVTVTLPTDTVPPTAPEISATEVGPRYAKLAWSSVDDAPELRYWIFRDGNLVIGPTTSTSGLVFPLAADTTHSFTAQARDSGGNWSTVGEPFAVTTPPAPDDTSPPTSPTNLLPEEFSDTEFNIFWTQSTDDVDPRFIIRYDVYVNGQLADVAIGTGRTSSIVYLVRGDNTITVVAVDSSGNASAPATITYHFGST